MKRGKQKVGYEIRIYNSWKMFLFQYFSNLFIHATVIGFNINNMKKVILYLSPLHVISILYS